MIPISYKQNWAAMADPMIVKEVCKSLKQMRLNKNISQQKLADISGINRVTISRMEAGRAATLLTVVQILRGLDRLEVLNVFREEPETSPIQLLLLEERQRKKASYKRNVQKTIKKKSEW
jgi:transcriptional regulator with XRE-family HTH domain